MKVYDLTVNGTSLYRPDGLLESNVIRIVFGNEYGYKRVVEFDLAHRVRQFSDEREVAESFKDIANKIVHIDDRAQLKETFNPFLDAYDIEYDTKGDA